MNKFEGPSPPAGLSVGELARRAGLAPATLRSWEARHDFPRPQRLAGGHRRYTEDDLGLVREVVRLRQTGLSVAAAIAAAHRDAEGAGPESIVAHLRGVHPELPTQILTKAVLAMLTSAVEDECCAAAPRAVLLAMFQREVFYRQAERRWLEMARTAECAVAFADFERLRRTPHGPIEVPLAADAPSRREWTLVCDSPGYSVCVAGWELPQALPVADADRLFETVWTLDAGIVRQASRVGVALLADADPELARSLEGRLAGRPPAASRDLQQATSLFARVLSYTQERRLSQPQGWEMSSSPRR